MDIIDDAIDCRTDADKIAFIRVIPLISNNNNEAMTESYIFCRQSCSIASVTHRPTTLDFSL